MIEMIVIGLAITAFQISIGLQEGFNMETVVFLLGLAALFALIWPVIIIITTISLKLDDWIPYKKRSKKEKALRNYKIWRYILAGGSLIWLYLIFNIT